MPATYRLDTPFTASYNRQEDWKKCCAVAMGFEWVDEFEENNEEEKNESKMNSGREEDDEDANNFFGPIQQVINFLDESQYNENPFFSEGKEDENESSSQADHWTENALRIQADLMRMSQWIRSKKHEYISLEMKDDEASLIQSTVTSFAATTASELESLRKIIPSSTSSNVASHRAGIVQILLSQLQEQITQPFGLLQKQRTRVAVQLWQNPLQCKLYQPKPDTKRNATMAQFFEEENEVEREQRFLPRHPVMPNDEDGDFISKYMQKRDVNVPNRPAFLVKLQERRMAAAAAAAHAKADDDTSQSQDNDESEFSMPIQQRQEQQKQQQQQLQQQKFNQQLPYQQQTQEELQQDWEQDLQQEAILLTQAVNNDLDSVQKMEQRMVEITTLISQFSNLVSEQQEDILLIHSSAKDAKDNIEKGKDNLVDATERTKRSKHYMAYSILAMSLTLLFFHILRN